MKIVERYYEIIDHYDIDRSVVSIAIFFFDRYVSHHPDEKNYLLAAMTCIYLAMKLHSSKMISPSTISSMSRGYFTERELLAMELVIFECLDWYLNPPTPAMFYEVIVPLIDDSPVKPSMKDRLKNLAQYLIELGAYFPFEKPSSIAYAAMLVAMEDMSISTEWFESLQLGHTSHTTDLWSERLHQVYSRPLYEIDSSLWLPFSSSSEIGTNPKKRKRKRSNQKHISASLTETASIMPCFSPRDVRVDCKIKEVCSPSK